MDSPGWLGENRARRSWPCTAEAQVRLDGTGRALLFLLGTIPARRGHEAMSEVDAEGWATTTVPVESVRHGVAARYG